MMRYHRYFSEVRLAALADYEQTLSSLEANAASLAAREAEARKREEALREQQADLETEREERKRLLTSLAAEAEDKTAERKRLEADRERLGDLLAELIRRAEVLDGQAFAASKGKLSWPLNGKVMNAFGQPRADGRLVWHGLMISADEGTEIRAVFRGRVVFSDWLRGFGLLTIVDHGSGYMTLYGNADLLTRQVGDWVETGETIARAGRSGGQSRSGLYFEVRQDGDARDPVIWLAKR
jgi:septal ring factor EnvC (AmiA/AmiB activator)